MEFQIDSWLDTFVHECSVAFSDRLCMVGLQGSYGRGEATENSDIDLVVVLDTLNTKDLSTYRNLLSTMPFSEKACGFCCGKRELLHWPRYDLFQLVNDTRVLYGSFLGLVPMLRRQDVQDAIQFGAANLYHAACHSYLYEKDQAARLCQLYKGTFFLLQAIYFYRTQLYITTKQELLPRLSGTEAEILERCIAREQITSYPPSEVDAAYQKLIAWCSELLTFA